MFSAAHGLRRALLFGFAETSVSIPDQLSMHRQKLHVSIQIFRRFRQHQI